MSSSPTYNPEALLQQASVANLQRVFVQRDFTEGTAVRFQTSLPERLTGKARAFRALVFFRTVSLCWMPALGLFLHLYCCLLDHCASKSTADCFVSGIIKHVFWLVDTPFFGDVTGIVKVFGEKLTLFSMMNSVQGCHV